MTEVLNLATGQTQTYVGTTPREAVIAAYAQARRDFNTWTYEARYGHLVTVGQHSVACGDFAAQKEGK